MKNSESGGYLYVFGQFVLDSRKRTLSRAGSPLSLTAKAFDVLFFLAQNPNRLVTKEELLKAVWGDTFVEEGNLTQYISHLRKALGDASEHDRLIVTLARKGYQFTADVTRVEVVDAAEQAPVQVSTTPGSRTDTQAGVESVAVAVASTTPGHWRKAAVVGVSAILLMAVGLASYRHLGGVPPPKSQRVMLAVLPFQNLTGDPNKEYLADGLTEETISQLSRLNREQLGVIARTSVMGYKHKDERLDQIGRDLSVQYVLENSLRESGGHIRLTAQLIQVKDQTHVWSQDYDYPVQDILTVEYDVAKALAHEIRVRLTSDQAGSVRAHRPNPEAFDAYLQGYYFFERNTNRDTEMAAKYFERATRLDPSYDLAWVWLSRTRNWQVNAQLISAEEGHRLAREAVERALALNPNLAEAHAQMARLKHQVDFDWAGADASARRALALDPENSGNLRSVASSAAILGRLDEAVQLSRRAVAMDPLNGDSWESLGENEYLAGRLADAAAASTKALELNPDVWPGPIQLSKIYIAQGRPQDALRETERVGYVPVRACLYPIVYYALGHKRESDAALSKLIVSYPSYAYAIAEVYAFQDRPDEAFDWLERAYDQRNSGLIGTKVDPFLKSLHKDPRFAAFLKKLNLPS
jgi:TolB-like protein/DNA-binding winged helix-turn-helix (wHTH) protein/Tfp pilus assembly protein PilF